MDSQQQLKYTEKRKNQLGGPSSWWTNYTLNGHSWMIILGGVKRTTSKELGQVTPKLQKNGPLLSFWLSDIARGSKCLLKTQDSAKW